MGDLHGGFGPADPVPSDAQPRMPVCRGQEGTVNILNNTYVRIVTIILVVQGAVFYAVAMRPEKMPPVGPLDLFPREFAGWQMYRESKIEQEVQDILKADDLLSREYRSPDGTA